MANIAEGFESGTSTEFRKYLTYARGSCAELGSHLYVALDAGYLTPSEFETALGLSEEVQRLINALRSQIGTT